MRTVSGICGAPPGGCGFGPRRRITVTVEGNRTPTCGCGSELIRQREIILGVNDDATVRARRERVDPALVQAYALMDSARKGRR